MKTNYGKLYRNALKTKDLGQRNKMLDEIIKKQPYFKDPNLYYNKLSCIVEMARKKSGKRKVNWDIFNKLMESEKYKNMFKETMDSFLFSYYLNSTDDKRGHYGETGVIYEFMQYYPAQERWKLIKLLNDSFEYDLKHKKYQESGDVCHVFLEQLIEIYKSYGEDKETLRQLESNYFAYAGMNSYYEYLDSSDMRESQSEETVDMADPKSSLGMALKLNPDNPIANYGLGRYYYEVEKDSDNALKYLSKAEENFILMWETYYYLGKINIDKKEYDEAKEYYKLALDLYDEGDVNTFLEDLVEDLNMLGGCRDELEAIISEKRIQEEDRRLLPNTKLIKANERLLGDDVLKEFEANLVTLKKEGFDVSSNLLEEHSRKGLRYAELAYFIGIKSIEYFRPCFANCYLYYYDALLNEILSKIVIPFKVEKINTMSPNILRVEVQNIWNKRKQEDNKRIKDNYKDLALFTSGKRERPTIGQVLGITSLPEDSSIIIKSLVQYFRDKCYVLLDQSFRDQLNAVKDARNKMHYVVDPEEAFKKQFQWFRNEILGSKDRKGLLPIFLESLKT